MRLFAACQGGTLVLGDGALTHDAAVLLDAGARDARMPLADYTVPTVIEALSGPDTGDDDPSLTLDETELCFNSKRDGGQGREDIWCATRQAGGGWAAPAPQAALNSDARETGVALAPDGLTLWFSSDRGDSDSLDIYRSARAERGTGWSAPERVVELSSDEDDLVSSVGGGDRLLFMARRAGEDDDYDVLMAARARSDEPWGAPRRLEQLDSDDHEESDGFLVADGLQLIFTRDEELILARRPSLDAEFDRGEPLGALNSGADDRDAWSSPDLGHVVFSSDRAGSYRLYEAFR